MLINRKNKALEADGILERKVYGDKPSIRVEYSMTEFGKTLMPVVNVIAKWGRNLGSSAGEMVDL